jgi:hypothetical protein
MSINTDSGREILERDWVFGGNTPKTFRSGLLEDIKPLPTGSELLPVLPIASNGDVETEQRQRSAGKGALHKHA